MYAFFIPPSLSLSVNLRLKTTTLHIAQHLDEEFDKEETDTI